MPIWMQQLLTALKASARFLLNEGTTLPGAWYLAGTGLESIGRHRWAIRMYELALRKADSSRDRRMFKIRQKWQFSLERVRAASGAARVRDPLFSCIAEPDTGTRLSAGDSRAVAGYYQVYWSFRGLVVEGFLRPRASPANVHVLLDGQLLREFRPAMVAGVLPYFQCLIQRSVVALFPKRGTLCVELSDGERLLFRRCEGTNVRVPHGSGALPSLGRNAVDKKGFIRNRGGASGQHKVQFLDAYQKASRFFEDHLDKSLFLLYGTLLGCHRNGDMIPGDDDFDVGYVSMQPTPETVRQEAMEIVLALVEAGFTISFNRNGRLFRLRLPGSPPDLHLDVHVVWFEGSSTWIHPQAKLRCTLEDFLPARQSCLGDVPVTVPARPEAFLEGYYGPGWRVPDPSYSTRSRQVGFGVRRHLARACVTPADFDAMQQQLANKGGSMAGGRLISIGSHSLYPLEDYDANCDW